MQPTYAVTLTSGKTVSIKTSKTANDVLAAFETLGLEVEEIRRYRWKGSNYYSLHNLDCFKPYCEGCS